MRWKVLSRDGIDPVRVKQAGVIEAADPFEAVEIAFEFEGEFDPATGKVDEDGVAIVIANAERPSRKFPSCRTCGAGKCVGHVKRGVSLCATVVRMD